MERLRSSHSAASPVGFQYSPHRCMHTCTCRHLRMRTCVHRRALAHTEGQACTHMCMHTSVHSLGPHFVSGEAYVNREAHCWGDDLLPTHFFIHLTSMLDSSCMPGHLPGAWKCLPSGSQQSSREHRQPQVNFIDKRRLEHSPRCWLLGGREGESSLGRKGGWQVVGGH